jgi:hypothetical protein
MSLRRMLRVELHHEIRNHIRGVNYIGRQADQPEPHTSIWGFPVAIGHRPSSTSSIEAEATNIVSILYTQAYGYEALLLPSVKDFALMFALPRATAAHHVRLISSIVTKEQLSHVKRLHLGFSEPSREHGGTAWPFTRFWSKRVAFISNAILACGLPQISQLNLANIITTPRTFTTFLARHKDSLSMVSPNEI